MKRLIADVNVNELLDKCINQLNTIQDDYYIFLQQLNNIFKTYPDIYTQIEQTVKLPTQQDIEDLVQMQKDLQDITNKLQNDSFAENYTETVVEEK